MGIIALLLLLGIIPIPVGALFTQPMMKHRTTSLAFVYIMGIMVLVAASELLSVPMTLLQKSFGTFVWTYNGIILVFLILAAVLCRTYIAALLKRTAETLRHADRGWILVLLAVYVPVIVLSFVTTYSYGDDRTYLSMVNDIVESDTLYQIDAATGKEVVFVNAKYALSSYWTWIAYLARMTGMHALVLCKTALMFIFVPMSYAIQGLLAGHWFRNDERKMRVYMLLVVLVSLFGGFSSYTVTYRLYTWVWQSKAFLAIIVLPFLLYYCCMIYEKSTSGWEYVLLLILIVAACSTTLTGTGLAVAMVCLLSVVYAFWRKQPGLVVKTVLACLPAFILMIAYMRYYYFLAFFGLLGE